MTDLLATVPCTEILRFGTLGTTVEDETPSAVCGKPAEFRISRPGVRPRLRCAMHAEPFRSLGFGDLIIEALGRCRGSEQRSKKPDPLRV